MQVRGVYSIGRGWGLRAGNSQADQTRDQDESKYLPTSNHRRLQRALSEGHRVFL